MDIRHSVGAAVKVNHSNIQFVKHSVVYAIQMIIRFIYIFYISV
jgi:hypothetical protein